VTDKSGREASAELLYDLLWQHFGALPSYQITRYNIKNADEQTAIDALLNVHDEPLAVQATGGGALEALCLALSHSFNREINIKQYHEHALQSAASAEAICYVEAEIDGASHIGIGRSQDVMGAGFQALIAAIAHHAAAIS
jgi:2-isopropylmalate synthase